MTTPNPNPTIAVPSFQSTRISENDGMPTSYFANFLTIFSSTVNDSFNKQGLHVPCLSWADIQKLAVSSNGTVLYDLTNNRFVVFINGSIRVIDTSPP